MLETFDYVVNNDEMRIVGEQFYKFSELDDPIVGFENRNCTMSEFHAPLFEVIKGCGYKPNSTHEGILSNNFYGTYLFGPLLVRNPHFCDYLIKKIADVYEFELNEFNIETIVTWCIKNIEYERLFNSVNILLIILYLIIFSPIIVRRTKR